MPWFRSGRYIGASAPTCSLVGFLEHLVCALPGRGSDRSRSTAGIHRAKATRSRPLGSGYRAGTHRSRASSVNSSPKLGGRPSVPWMRSWSDASTPARPGRVELAKPIEGRRLARYLVADRPLARAVQCPIVRFAGGIAAGASRRSANLQGHQVLAAGPCHVGMVTPRVAQDVRMQAGDASAHPDVPDGLGDARVGQATLAAQPEPRFVGVGMSPAEALVSLEGLDRPRADRGEPLAATLSKSRTCPRAKSMSRSSASRDHRRFATSARRAPVSKKIRMSAASRRSSNVRPSQAATSARSSSRVRTVGK